MCYEFENLKLALKDHEAYSNTVFAPVICAHFFLFWPLKNWGA